MIPPVKKALLSAGLTLLLTACGGGGEVACEAMYWDAEEELGTCLPDGWHVLDRDQLDERGVPGEVIVGFQADTPVSGQFATVVVTHEALNDDMTSAEYSDASVISIQGLPGYNEIDQQTIAIDEEDVTLHVYTAQPREEQPESRFYQVSAAKGSDGYTFTGATPVSVPDELEEQVLLIVRSATFTEPETEE